MKRSLCGIDKGLEMKIDALDKLLDVTEQVAVIEDKIRELEATR